MSDEGKFTHLDEEGRASMVDVSGKDPTRRVAMAACRVRLGKRIFEALVQGRVPKGDVPAAARIAGIQAAKKTWELIPLCHPLALDQVRIELHPLPNEEALEITCQVVCTGRTGAEMEALTGCAGAALTVYDMCKALGRGIRIDDLRLLRKEGGRGGMWRAPEGGEGSSREE